MLPGQKKDAGVYASGVNKSEVRAPFDCTSSEGDVKPFHWQEGRSIVYDAGLADAIGSIDAAVLFHHLSFWSDKAKREDGFLYKSRQEIRDEISMPQQKQRTALNKLIEAGLVATKTIRAKGVPMVHYQVLVNIKKTPIIKNDLLIDQPAIVETTQAPIVKTTMAQNEHKAIVKTTNPFVKTTNHKHKKTTEDILLTSLRSVSNIVEPRNETKQFFEDETIQQSIVANLIEKGLSKETSEREIKKFVDYWTERNATGRKQRWEFEKTFEVKHRLATWFSRLQTFNKQTKGVQL